ncbi:hypothetical protein JB92DRAFT_3177189 [Gautieria morchelliformis]|nr:hypothetical protein JB92DRAFT_3177189 [Gautieria morchelliformis]
MPLISCPYCFKVLPTQQGVCLHLAHRAPCKSAHQVALAQRQVRVYDPFDPETHPRDDEPSAGWQSEAMDVEFDQLDPPPDTSMDNGLASNPRSQVGHSSSMVPTNRPPAPGSPHTWRYFLDLQSLYEPFADQEEWELAQRLMTSGMSFTNMDKLFKLPIVDALPPGGPEFLCESITVHGDVKDVNGEYMVEELELFYRDPVECIRELLGNLAFREVLHYVPEHIFEDEKRTERIYNEMWMANWWWDLQSKLPSGATICPVILASYKTRLSQFSGDKTAWRVYLTIGNIPKATRRKVSAHANILLGYLPISKLECFSAGTCKSQGWQLFHYLEWMFFAQTVASERKTGVQYASATLRIMGTPLPLSSQMTLALFFDVRKIQDSPCRLESDVRGQAAENVTVMVILPEWLPDLMDAHVVTGMSPFRTIGVNVLNVIYALDRFHHYKGVFVDSKIQEHFQSPKLHMIEHYTESIISWGTADGFNTELPERLHIDFSKVGYRASIRKDFIIQMTRWLTRQEQPHSFGSFLSSLSPGEADVDDKDCEENLGRLVRFILVPTAAPPVSLAASVLEETVGRTYHIAKRPSFPNTSVSRLINEFGATEFIPALTAFLRFYLPRCTLDFSVYAWLPVYKRISFMLHSIQQIDDTVIKDIVRATPRVPRPGRTPEVPEHFNTVLIHYGMNAQETGALGYRVG